MRACRIEENSCRLLWCQEIEKTKWGQGTRQSRYAVGQSLTERTQSIVPWYSRGLASPLACSLSKVLLSEFLFQMLWCDCLVFLHWYKSNHQFILFELRQFLIVYAVELLSAYDIQKLVEYRNISKWVKISTPSIYKKWFNWNRKVLFQVGLKRKGICRKNRCIP